MRRFATAFMVATAGTAMTAATAQAATIGITPLKACYLTGESDTLSGVGYSPNGVVNIAVDGVQVFQLQADASGALRTSLRFGTMKAVKTHTLTATDQTNPAFTASVSFVGTKHQVTVKPTNSRPGRKSKMRGYGFLSGPKAYMHVRNHGVSSDTLVGRPKGPCGTFGPTKRRIVSAGAASGNYRVQFDAKKKYSKKTRPRLVYTLRVFRTFKAASASGFAGATPLSTWTKVG